MNHSHLPSNDIKVSQSSHFLTKTSLMLHTFFGYINPPRFLEEGRSPNQTEIKLPLLVNTKQLWTKTKSIQSSISGGGNCQQVIAG